MKPTLHFPLPFVVVYGKKSYRIKPYFDNVLKVLSIQKEENLTNADKLNLSLYLLVKKKCGRLTEHDKVELLNVVYDVLMDGGADPDGKAPVFDFQQDAGYIYSSFLYDYGIDLYKQQGRLHWWAFLQLFKGLSDKSKIVQIMQIRTKPFPVPTKHNGEERTNLAKLKAQYALSITKDERERNYAAGLKRLAGIMQGLADKEVKYQCQTEK